MSRASVLMLLGILTALTPFSGLPISLRSFLSVLFGLSIFAFGFSARVQVAHTPEQPATAE
jgi:hypothetical protein